MRKNSRTSISGFRSIKFLLRKEFLQMKRNKFIPKVAIVLPFVALTLFPMVANFDIKNIKLAVVDNSRSTYSTRFINKISSTSHFQLVEIPNSYSNALWLVEQDIADIILEIPPKFEEELVTNRKTSVHISTNTVNGMKGGLSSAYLMSIVNDFSSEIRSEWVQTGSRINAPSFEIVPRYNFNPLLEYKYTMIPAIMMMMLAVITGFLPALNIVGEKEKGTIEQMNVTPVSRISLILAKLIPYWIIGIAVLTICFFVAWLFYGMISVGSYGLIYLFAAVFTLAFSGFGLMISNYATTVQQGMFIMFFFVITFIFLSGLYTPVSSMPEWTQAFSRISPLRYMVEVLRFIFLKGSDFSALKWHFAALCGFAVLFNSWAVLSYRKSS